VFSIDAIFVYSDILEIAVGGFILVIVNIGTVK